MNMNFKGLVNLHTLPVAVPELPLYEAVINSMQSIEDANIKDGKIEIMIERDPQTSYFMKHWETDIVNIIIKDNGVGFTEENFNSFNTYVSELKMQKGCKGVGRILWLKAYDGVEVESIYKENDFFMKRTFRFNLDHEIYNMTNEKMVGEQKVFTTVKLCGLRNDYKKHHKKIDTLAKNILNHCFAYYVLGNPPKIVISDDRETIDLDSLYEENIRGNTHVVHTNINNINFTIIHSKNYLISSNTYEANLCAHQRVV